MKVSPGIADQGLIGNLHPAALVSRSGELSFLSFPRFDSPTLFTGLLDPEKGGLWSIALLKAQNTEPQYDQAVDLMLDPDNAKQPDHSKDLKIRQYYRRDTAILVTRLMSAEAVVEIIDFMPPVEDLNHCQVIRIVRCLVGTARLSMHFEPRYPYGKTPVRMTKKQGKGILLDLQEDGRAILMGADEGFSLKNPNLLDLTFDLDAKSACPQRTFVFQSDDCPQPEDGDLEGFGESLYQYTNDYWKLWVESIDYTGKFREMIVRSAITLKLCTSREYGSSVAAITFGLPEELGGERNWDYRYAWIRDSAFTMYAMLRLGLSTEAKAFISWIEKRCEELGSAADLSLMYRVDGTADLEEKELDHLAGYRDSKPVRIGNGAQSQFQLDIYGELIDTIYLYDRFGHEITFHFWQYVQALINYVCEVWRKPDHGIWEVRSEMKQFTVSKVMAWVAIDRGIRIAQHRGFPAPYERWQHERDELFEAIYTDHIHPETDTFTQHTETTELDASLLLLPMLRFVTADEPAFQKTLSLIEAQLVDDCLVKRYNPKNGSADGLSGDEGYFTMCSFWYVEVLAKSGRFEEAEELITKLLSYANHVGLYSEEISLGGEQLGNFPQAFTHLALISAVLQLDEQLKNGRSAIKSNPKG